MLHTLKGFLLFTLLLIGHSLGAQYVTLPMDSSLLPPKKAPGELHILSWNIKMLPRMALGANYGPLRRARIIAQFMNRSDHDIIVFQECFDSKARQILKREMKAEYPYIIGPANKSPFNIKTNSGIMIFSRIPITHLGEIDFKDCQGDDCLAKKGAMLVGVKTKETQFQLLGTHLEAGGPDSIYFNQYREIRDLINKHQEEGIPQVLCGDYNSSQKKKRYAVMLETLEAENAPIVNAEGFPEGYLLNDMKKKPKMRNPKNLVDHILLRSNGNPPQIFDRFLTVYRHDWHAKRRDLSDHFALLLKLKWN